MGISLRGGQAGFDGVTAKPDGDLNFWPIIASRTASTSVVPA
jgi:hypothetical protein